MFEIVTVFRWLLPVLYISECPVSVVCFVQPEPTRVLYDVVWSTKSIPGKLNQSNKTYRTYC